MFWVSPLPLGLSSKGNIFTWASGNGGLANGLWGACRCTNSIYLWVTVPPLPPGDELSSSPHSPKMSGSSGRIWTETWGRRRKHKTDSKENPNSNHWVFINSRTGRDRISRARRVTPQPDQKPTWGQTRSIFYFLNFCKQVCLPNINNHSLSGAHLLWCFRLTLMLT